jgi:RNA 2',3'-cyclic 3'-phosphodiesterase
MQNSLRCFIALEIPKEIQDSLVKVINLAQLIPTNGFRPVRTGMIHITLKFLGDTPQSIIPEIKQILSQIAVTQPTFQLQIRGIGAFPSWDHPRIIWAGLTYPPELQALTTQVNNQIEPVGYPIDNRPFSPHLTLARVSEGADITRVKQSIAVLRQNSNMIFGNITIAKITLFESTLQRGGSIYTPLSTHDFGHGKV